MEIILHTRTLITNLFGIRIIQAYINNHSDLCNKYAYFANLFLECAHILSKNDGINIKNRRFVKTCLLSFVLNTVNQVAFRYLILSYHSSGFSQMMNVYCCHVFYIYSRIWFPCFHSRILNFYFQIKLIITYLSLRKLEAQGVLDLRNIQRRSLCSNLIFFIALA